MGLPYLGATNRELADLYCTKSYVTASDIRKFFGVSSATAGLVVRSCAEYAKQNELDVYHAGRRAVVPVQILFDMYHWDIDTITKAIEREAKL